MSVCDRPADGTEVERIVISPMGSEDSQNQIFVGYSGVDQSDKSLTVYRYSDSEVQQLFTAAYTMFDVADLDGDQGTGTAGAGETHRKHFLLCGNVPPAKRDGKGQRQAGSADWLYGFQSGAVRQTGGRHHRHLYRRCHRSLLAANGSPPRTGETLAYVLADSDVVAKTNRSVGYLSMDLDEDGSVEIPVQEPFPGYGADSSDQVRLTRWLAFPAASCKRKCGGISA